MATVVSLTPAVFHLSERVNRVLRTYGKRPIVPRGPRLAPLLTGVLRGIEQALGATQHRAAVFTGTGSSAMAAVLGSCLGPKERLLVVRNGAYGDRLLAFAKQLRQPVVDLASPYGERPDLDKLMTLLARDEVDAVAMVYGATSTCTLNPVAEVGALCKRYGKKLFVDGVSAAFIEPLELDAWNISALMGSCNKGLHSHPNLTMCLIRDDLLAAMAELPQRAPSLELLHIIRSQERGAHPYTIDPMSLLLVAAALEHLADQGGVKGRHGIYQERAKKLRKGYERLGLAIARWPLVPLASIGTALEIPTQVSYEELARRLSTRAVDGHTFEIYSAQGKLSDKLFRVFHMGDYELEVYDVFLRALRAALAG